MRLCRDTSGHLNPTAVEAALCRSFAAMDFEILADAARTGARSGSTACVVLQLGGHLYCAHAGVPLVQCSALFGLRGLFCWLHKLFCRVRRNVSLATGPG